MASIFQAFPQLRTAAPRLTRRLFVCRPCLNLDAPARAFPARPSSILKQVRCKSTHPLPVRFVLPNPNATPAAPAKDHGTKGSSWPNLTDRRVAWWCFGSALSVFGIVVFGGLTRLTESGLSITEWRPVTGSLPPMNDADWESEFLKYKASPEFKQLNSQMTLDEFKKIYFMEWFHRLWGRVIGLTFVIPTVYFIARRKVTPSVAVKLVGICALIGFQGFLGWWMVKSGLKDDLFAEGSHPRVSQYRLAAHLGTAFVVYCSMLQTGLAIIKEYHLVSNPQGSAAWVGTMLSPAIRRYRRTVVGLFLLAFTTAMSGALVAGLDAGLIYNEFPKMGLGLTPPKKELFDPFYSHVPDQSDLWWRNMLENPSLVQLDHRILAMTTFTAVLSFAAWTRFSKPLQTHLNPHARQAAYLMARVVVLQATLGIGTLIYMVPTWLAAAHQAGALLLLTSTVILYNRIAIPRRAIIRQVNIKPPGPESVSAPVFYRTPTPPVKPTPLKPKFKTR